MHPLGAVDVAQVSLAGTEMLVDFASWQTVKRVHIVVNGRTRTTMHVRSLLARLKVPLELSNAGSYIMMIADGDAPLPGRGSQACRSGRGRCLLCANLRSTSTICASFACRSPIRP
jgi:hypothetical protein